MHWTAQVAIVGLLAVLVGLGGYALTQGVPERDDRTTLDRFRDETRTERLEIGLAFCEKVRRDVAAGRVSVQPGSTAAACL